MSFLFAMARDDARRLDLFPLIGGSEVNTMASRPALMSILQGRQPVANATWKKVLAKAW